MIDTLIFDFGQVLVRFVPELMVSPYVTDPDDKKLLGEVIFDRLYWDRLDAGTITDEELETLAKARLPERLHPFMEQIYRNWYRHLPEIPGMRGIIRDAKREGKRVFVLSNICKTFPAYVGDFPVFSEIDGYVFSGVCGITKPNPAIFRHLCEKFSVDPAGAVFIDDSPRNIEGARAAGIRGILFDGDAARLRTALSAMEAGSLKD